MTRHHEKLARNNTDIERLARFIGYEYVPEEGQSGCGDSWRPIDDDGSHGHLDEFDPFTRLDDAMMVAEKMIARDCDFKLWNHDLGFGCRIGTLGCSAKDGHGKTTAEAISLAALAYIEATEKK